MNQEIIKYSILVVVGFVMYAMGFKKNFTAKVLQYITDAEIEYKHLEKSGKEKMAYAIKRFRNDFIPLAFRALISDEWIETIIQAVFDQAQEFIKTQIDKIIKKFVGE